MNAEALTTLRANVAKLNARDAEFAQSLISQYDRRGSLSDKQWPWVERLVERTLPKPEPKADVLGLTKLTELFDKASENLQRPQVAFSCSAGEFVVTKAGDASRNPGHLYVKDVCGTYLGKVNPRGQLFIARDATHTHGDVFQALEAFAEDPAEKAAAYGRATGNCCFCRRALTDTRSVEVGYGPICAERWSLPWGE